MAGRLAGDVDGAPSPGSYRVPRSVVNRFSSDVAGFRGRHACSGHGHARRLPRRGMRAVGKDRRARRRRRRARPGARARLGGDVLDGPVDVFLPRYRGMAKPAGASNAPPSPSRTRGRPQGRCRDRPRRRHGRLPTAPDRPAAGLRSRRAVRRRRRATTPTTRGGSGCCAGRRSRCCVPTRGGLDVLHMHDWHAAPRRPDARRPLPRCPGLAGAAVVMTVHNLAYHGWTPAGRVPELGLGPGDAARRAPRASTCWGRASRGPSSSTRFARVRAEALTPEFGMGLDGALRATRRPILRDPQWPRHGRCGTRPRIRRSRRAYSRENRAGKAACRADLLDPDRVRSGGRRPGGRR